MGFKIMTRSLDFADFALSSSLEAYRSVKLMGKIDAAINWSRVDAVLMQLYTVGTSQEGQSLSAHLAVQMPAAAKMVWHKAEGEGAKKIVRPK